MWLVVSIWYDQSSTSRNRVTKRSFLENDRICQLLCDGVLIVRMGHTKPKWENHNHALPIAWEVILKSMGSNLEYDGCHWKWCCPIWPCFNFWKCSTSFMMRLSIDAKANTFTFFVHFIAWSMPRVEFCQWMFHLKAGRVGCWTPKAVPFLYLNVLAPFYPFRCHDNTYWTPYHGCPKKSRNWSQIWMTFLYVAQMQSGFCPKC